MAWASAVSDLVSSKRLHPSGEPPQPQRGGHSFTSHLAGIIFMRVLPQGQKVTQPAAASSRDLRTRTDNKPSCGVNGCQCLSHVSNLWWRFTAMIDSVPHASTRVKRRLADSCCKAPQGSGGCSSHRVPFAAESPQLSRFGQSGKSLHFLQLDGKFLRFRTAARLCLMHGGKASEVCC